jgi:integrase
MGRRALPYSLLRRKITLESGKVITMYSYRIKDETGKLRTIATGKSTKTDATAYLMELHKQGRLLPETKSRVPTIQAYSAEFWKFDGERVKSALLRKRLTPAYCNANHRTIELHWWPAYGKKHLDDLTVRDIEALITLKSSGDAENGIKPLSTKMTNQIIQAMKAVYAEAVRLGDLDSSPFDRVQAVQLKKTARGMLTPQEAFQVLSKAEYFETPILWAMNLTAATTGARAGELLGLKVKCVFKDRIEICGVKRAKVGFIEDTKTGDRGFRFIPIPKVTASALASLGKGKKPEDFVFGDLPFYITSQSISEALENAGILTKAERVKRGVDFHSWRHWYNTMLRGRVSDVALRATTGHTTEEMTDNYSHQLEEHLVEVTKAQNEVFAKIEIS